MYFLVIFIMSVVQSQNICIYRLCFCSSCLIKTLIALCSSFIDCLNSSKDLKVWFTSCSLYSLFHGLFFILFIVTDKTFWLVFILLWLIVVHHVWRFLRWHWSNCVLSFFLSWLFHSLHNCVLRISCLFCSLMIDCVILCLISLPLCFQLWLIISFSSNFMEFEHIYIVFWLIVYCSLKQRFSIHCRGWNSCNYHLMYWRLDSNI